MNRPSLSAITSIVAAVAGMIILVNCSASDDDGSRNSEGDTTSAYAGQEARGIKSLSPEDIESLQEGTGVAFGGMAKLAELNGYPGPTHVLDLEKELNLTGEQESEIEDVYNQMKAEAVRLGEQIIAAEKDMNDRFADRSITDVELEGLLQESAGLYEKLRYVHLEAHLQMIDILSPEQIGLYNELRGYTSSSDPCDNVPEGHDRELWRLHNNCD